MLGIQYLIELDSINKLKMKFNFIYYIVKFYSDYLSSMMSLSTQPRGRKGCHGYIFFVDEIIWQIKLNFRNLKFYVKGVAKI